MFLTSSDEPHGEPELDTVNIITKALVEKFGDKAVDVAERQLETASPESRDKWDAIVSQLIQ